MDTPPDVDAFLHELAGVRRSEQLERLLQFFADNVSRWDRGTVALLCDCLETKQTPERRMLAEVLEGHLALRDLRDAMKRDLTNGAAKDVNGGL